MSSPTLLSVSGEGTTGKTARLVAKLDAPADVTVDFSIDIGGGPVSVGSAPTNNTDTAELDNVPLTGVSADVYPTGVGAVIEGDPSTSINGELTVFAAPPPPEVPEPPTPLTPPEPEPEPAPQSFFGGDAGSQTPAESFEQESSAPGIPASTAPFDGAVTPDPFTTNTNGDPFGQGACVNSFTGDTCVNSYTQGANIEPYGEGACINPYAGSSNVDAFTPASNDSSPYPSIGPAGLNYTPSDASIGSGDINYSPEPIENTSVAPSYSGEKYPGFESADGTGPSDLGYSPLEPIENQSAAPAYSPEKDPNYTPLDDGNYPSREPIENQAQIPANDVFDPKSPGWQEEKEPDSSGPSSWADAMYTARRGIAQTMGPVDASGEPLTGTYYLWSGDADKAAAKAAIADDNSGWLMSETQQGEQGAKDFAGALREEAATQFPGKAFSDDELFALAKAKSLRLPDEEFRAIWDPPSASVARQAVLGDLPVQGNLVSDPAAASVQARVEVPTVQAWGLGAAGVMGASGFLTMYASSQTDNAGVQVTGALAGTTEVTGGIIYGSGAILTNSELMAIGSGLGRFGGGAGMAIMSGYNLVGDVQRGDTAAAVADSAGALGGTLLATAPLFGPAAPFVAGAGLALGAFSLGYHLAEWIEHR